MGGDSVGFVAIFISCLALGLQFASMFHRNREAEAAVSANADARTKENERFMAMMQLLSEKLPGGLKR